MNCRAMSLILGQKDHLANVQNRYKTGKFWDSSP